MSSVLKTLVNKPKYNHIIIPLSSGKDSQLVLQNVLSLIKDSSKVIPLFHDVGWDHPYVYEHLEYIEKAYDVTVERTHGLTIKKSGEVVATMEDVIRKFKMFPGIHHRTCTQYLKQYAFRSWVSAYFKQYGYRKVLVLFGMRKAESSKRATTYEYVSHRDVYAINDLFPRKYNRHQNRAIDVNLPIIHLQNKAVFKEILDAGYKINPLYAEGNDRVGCYPCLLSTRERQMACFETPFGKKQMCKIKALEKELGIEYEMYDTDQGSCEACNI